MKLESEEYPFVSLSETTNSSPSGQILSKSVLITLRNKSPEQVWKAYQELKSLIDNKEEDKPEKKVKNNPRKQEEQIEKEEKKDNPGTCPKCGGLLQEKQGISKKTGQPYHFVGCSNFQSGCNFTKPFISEAEKKMPCDEDLLTVFAE